MPAALGIWERSPSSMPEDTQQVIRGINWRETFPFTHIFRSFRVAIHPSKLILALVAILLLYLGGRVLDGIWPLKSKGVPNEIELYESARAARMTMAAEEGRNPLRAEAEAPGRAATRNFYATRKAARDAIEAQYAEALVDAKVEPEPGKPITPEQAKDAAADAR